MTENKKGSRVLWLVNTDTHVDHVWWKDPGPCETIGIEQFIEKSAYDALAEQLKTMSDNCISLTLHNSRVDALEKQIEELRVERDGARAALEDRDKMHELQLQGIKKQMFRQEAELRSENKELKRALEISEGRSKLRGDSLLSASQELEKLREKLGAARSYMEHKDSCDSRNASTAYDFGPCNCDCGFDEALEKLDEAKG